MVRDSEETAKGEPMSEDDTPKFDGLQGVATASPPGKPDQLQRRQEPIASTTTRKSTLSGYKPHTVRKSQREAPPDDGIFEDIAAELSAVELFDEFYDAGCRLISMDCPVLPVNGKRPCNKAGLPMRKWQTVKCDGARLLRGLQGALNPKPGTQGEIPDSAPGIGLRMGPGSVIDIETESDDERIAVVHLFRDCQAPKTVSFTSRRGQHDLWKWDDRFAELGGVFDYKTPEGKSVKIRTGAGAKGAQSVIPPSPERAWLPGCSLYEIEPSPLPEKVIQRLLQQARAKRRSKPTKSPSKPSRSACDAEIRAATVAIHSLSSSASLRSSSASLRSSSQCLQLPSDTIDVLRDTYESSKSNASEGGIETLVSGDAHAISCTSSPDLGDCCQPSPQPLAVVEAIAASVPTCFGKRHECVFYLVRRLRAIPEFRLVTRAWVESSEGCRRLLPVLWEWYCRSKSFIKHADLDECWYDFREAWDHVRQPWGEKLILIYERSLTKQVPAEVIKHLGLFDSEKNRRLALFCAELQREERDKPFKLDGRACSEVMKLSQKTVSCKLRQFAELGILERTFEGRRKRSAEYLYLLALDTEMPTLPASARSFSGIPPQAASHFVTS